MRVPLVFTHHTLYERYTHYVPLDSPALKRFAIRLATEYAKLCDQVIAPSESIARLLRERGVTTPIAAIPTGIDTGFFAAGNGARFREQAGIPPDARVIGHTGRLAREKNLLFLADALAPCLAADPRAVLLVVGDGDARAEMLDRLRPHAAPGQLHFAGNQSGPALADAYAAMDCFVFASQTETQGLVLAEALAAGKPVVALDGPGVREIVRDGENGLLLDADASARDFSAALDRLLHDPARFPSSAARASAADYASDRCVDRVLDCYAALIDRQPRGPAAADSGAWDRLLAGIGVEWSLLVEKMSAAAAAVGETPATEARLD
jgi:glycosyltransferase involved in cell wall biosynthesis